MFCLILVLDPTVADLPLGKHCHMLTIHSLMSCTSVILKKIGQLAFGNHRGIVLRKTGWLVLEAFGGYLLEEKRGIVPHKFPPLKTLLGKTRYLMPEAFAVFYQED